ncbi:MAG: STAS domain-containing protein [Phycisphaerales bacterium]
MPLGNFFGKSKKPDDNAQPAGGGEVLLDSVHARAEGMPGYAAATVKTERIAEREGPILVTELSQAAKSRDHRIILDLAEVYLISSAGIGSLVQLHRACAADNGKLVLFGLNRELLELLRIARLDRMFNIAKSREDAVEAVA